MAKLCKVKTVCHYFYTSYVYELSEPYWVTTASACLSNWPHIKFTYKSFFPILIHVLECTFMHVQEDKIKTLFKFKDGWHQIARANKPVALYNTK